MTFDILYRFRLFAAHLSVCGLSFLFLPLSSFWGTEELATWVGSLGLWVFKRDISSLSGIQGSCHPGLIPESCYSSSLLFPSSSFFVPSMTESSVWFETETSSLHYFFPPGFQRVASTGCRILNLSSTALPVFGYFVTITGSLLCVRGLMFLRCLGDEFLQVLVGLRPGFTWNLRASVSCFSVSGLLPILTLCGSYRF